MENTNVSISVVMSTYNGSKFIRKAIQSILNQTFIDFELLIIDDASVDNTLEIINSFTDKRIKVINNKENLGLTKSLNKGIRLSEGHYIARMDDDDISSPDRLQKQYDFMEKNKDIALCGSLGYIIDEQGERIGEKNLAVKDIKKKLLFNNQFIHSSLLICKEALDEIGYYNETFKRAQDYELVLRIASKYKVANLEERLIEWRQRPGSISFSSKKQKKFAIKARWLAITKYKYPFFKGLFHIVLRMGQLLT